jgi:hypothetical protein
MKHTIHTSRTIMFAELSEVMSFEGKGSDYLAIMEDNVFNKRTESNKKKTIRYLTQLYGFNRNDDPFKAFEEYWYKAKEESRPLLAFVYALSRDYLLQESVAFVKAVPYENKANIEGFDHNISRQHPDRFSPKTLRSVAQNIASSWKQAGFIEGKMKNIRKENTPDYLVVAFALLLAYLQGLRGDFMLEDICVKSLDVEKETLFNLIKTAADYDLLQYNHSGSTMVITFNNFSKAVENV